MAKRRLTVNADDFGFTTDVNRGILEAHLKGILTSATLMANGAAFADAVQKSREHPSLDIGVHLVLVGGEAVSRPGRALPGSIAGLIRRLAARRLDVYAEFRAQCEKVCEAGIRPTHVDTHKHTHLLPPVLEAVCRVAHEFGIRWVRRPFDLPLTGAASDTHWTRRGLARSLGLLNARFVSRTAHFGCASTDHFAGFQITGRYSSDDVIHLVRNLPEGWTEFMVHPGFCTDELRGAATRLKESREKELRALTDPDVRTAIEAAGVELTSFPVTAA